MSAEWRPRADQRAREARAALLRRLRAHFDATGALEVDTPVLASAATTDPNVASVRADGGGAAGWLHASPELPMKRLLADGCGDCWQIAKVFRAGERGRRHNPEFTLLEWYRVGWPLDALIDETTALIGLARPGAAVSRLSYREAWQAVGVDWRDAAAVRAALAAAGQSQPLGLAQADTDAWLDLGFSTLVAPRFDPAAITVVHGYPASQAALARLVPCDGEQLAARFEVYVGELELANGYHELADPVEQRQRIAAEQARARAAGAAPVAVDERFLAALAAGLPDCCGVALGLDRLLMVALGVEHIDAVLNFPREIA